MEDTLHSDCRGSKVPGMQTPLTSAFSGGEMSGGSAPQNCNTVCSRGVYVERTFHGVLGDFNGAGHTLLNHLHRLCASDWEGYGVLVMEKVSGYSTPRCTLGIRLKAY